MAIPVYGCGSFVCSKNALCALNIAYIVVAVILVSVGAYAHESSIVSSISIAIGIICVGVFLGCVAVLGVFGAYKHHQVALFFYMVILSLIFIVQFCVAIACVALTDEQVNKLVITGWHTSSNITRLDAEQHFDCCGLENVETGYACEKLSCATTTCEACLPLLTAASNHAAQLAGRIGIIFGFTEIIGIWLAMRFRNLKNPSVNPDLYV